MSFDVTASFRVGPRHGEDSDEYRRYQVHAEAHSAYLIDAVIDGIKKSLALKTSIDLMRFAAKLSEDIFVD